MKAAAFGFLLLSLLLASCAPAARRAVVSAALPTAEADPHLWLEEVTGEKALDWVRARNARTESDLAATPEFARMEGSFLEVLDSKERIPVPSMRGGYLYNFWKDGANPRGLWRRTTLDEYRKAQPAWDLLLDLDALGRAEGENWVWHGAQILKPDGRRALVSLSRGGADAEVTREFDLESRRFVAGGFTLPEAKSEVSWIDENTIYVATDFGPGTLTDSGYPRVAKVWKRGQPLAEAPTVFEGKPSDMAVSAYCDDAPGFGRHFVRRTITFYSGETFLRDPGGALRRIEVPLDAAASVHREWLLVELRTPWTVGARTYPAGALLASRLDDFMAGGRNLQVLFEPSSTVSLSAYDWTLHRLVLTTLDDVKCRLWVLTPGPGEWTREALTDAPELSTVSVEAVDPDASDDFFFTRADFLTPTTLFLARPHQAPEKIKELPAFFDASDMTVSQHFAVSEDGTRVPYFEVAPKTVQMNSRNPTLLAGYGGFEISEVPFYSGLVGRGWLSRGGVYVLANIRGGGEYGPRWHQAALREKRHRAYEDFAAVAKDLVARKVTRPERMGIIGGSNGGLLVGNMITRYPQLFGAVVCQVPLLDMKRYSHLLAGASWMAEYGDPDVPEEWGFIRTFSPYHNLRMGVPYPPVFFATSTRDDRVHPGHARKMMAAMEALGADVRYYENIEGGHGGAADNRQAAHMWALAYAFLWKELTPGP
jgi:prolyl oligopeptidase